jgi:DNA-binding NtrC family response regulator
MTIMTGALRADNRVEEDSTPLRPHGDFPGASGIVGQSMGVRQARGLALRYAEFDDPVLVTGETGTGKDLLAREIHEFSPRRSGAFVPVNCAGVPDSLLASELFGYEKGAFTGANDRRPGCVLAADGGTLFLDEIGDMSPAGQAHLLRFLQDKKVQPLGATKARSVDVRVIAATNRDLAASVACGEFRADLYHRLNFLSVHLPPLREREGDVELLVRHFTTTFARELNVPAKTVSAGAMEWAKAYGWPGNVRELISCIRRVLILNDNATIEREDLGHRGALAKAPAAQAKGGEASADRDAARPGHLPVGLGPTPQDCRLTVPGQTLSEAKRALEIRMVSEAMRRHSCKIARVARDLGISRATVYKILDRSGDQEAVGDR